MSKICPIPKMYNVLYQKYTICSLLKEKFHKTFTVVKILSKTWFSSFPNIRIIYPFVSKNCISVIGAYSIKVVIKKMYGKMLNL